MNCCNNNGQCCGGHDCPAHKEPISDTEPLSWIESVLIWTIIIGLSVLSFTCIAVAAGYVYAQLGGF